MIEFKKPLINDKDLFENNTNQPKDAGMALILITLILNYFFKIDSLIALSILLLILNMTFPSIYKPIAKVWFGVSLLIGTFMSRVLLTVIFFVMVTPMGLIRKVLGKDKMQLKNWKKKSESVFVIRNHLYTKNDISKPY